MLVTPVVPLLLEFWKSAKSAINAFVVVVVFFVGRANKWQTGYDRSLAECKKKNCNLTLVVRLWTQPDCKCDSDSDQGKGVGTELNREWERISERSQ